MITLIELLAVISGGLFGALLARRKQMDFVGVFFVALATAFGGGTLRDLFLGRQPLFWIEHHHYPVIVFGLALGVAACPRIPGWIERLLVVPDAFGLGLFCIAGISAAVDSQVAPFIAVLMGVITGTFGGVIGDIVCNEIPSLFHPNTPLYATAAFLGGWVYLLNLWWGVGEGLNLLVSIGLIVTLRLLAWRFDWRLPNYPGVLPKTE